jgi:HAD superfamily hydrolase (TIGR01509 family)
MIILKLLMNQMPEAVILDMDGLMLDTEPIYYISWQSAVAELGYEVSQEFYASLIGKCNEDCEKALLDKVGRDFPLTDFRVMQHHFWEKYVIQHGIKCKPGLVDLLKLLKIRTIPYLIATSSTRKDAEMSLSLAGLEIEPDCIVTADDVKNRKPAPDIYLKALERLKLSSNQCIAIEDSNAGVKSALAAGIRVIMIPDLQEPDEETLRKAYRILESLYDAVEIIDIHSYNK